MNESRNILQDVSISDLKANIREYSNILNSLKNAPEIKKKDLQLTKTAVLQMKKEEKRFYLWDKIKESFQSNVYEDAHRLINLTHKSYEQFKSLTGSQYNTHKFITSKAIEILNVQSESADTLLEYCVFPDSSKSDMSDLIFEGHFYGKITSRKYGNFIDSLFPRVAILLEGIKKVTNGFDEDIHEHAVGNFTTNYTHSMNADRKLICLGVAAHYLQDLTAPHHAGNYPAVPYVDHYFFEKFASQYLYGQPNITISKSGYKKFKSQLQSAPAQTEQFAKEIYALAVPYVDYVKRDSYAKLADIDKSAAFMDEEIEACNSFLISGVNKDWTSAIDGAIPIAVYATAYLFESALQ